MSSTLSCPKNFSSQNRTKAIVFFRQWCLRLQKIYVLFWKQISFKQLSCNNYFYRPVFLKSMAFNQLFSSFDLKLWAGADLSFTYNNCTTDICHFIWRCHKQSDINIVLTKITFDNQMQKNLKWFSPYRTHGSSLVAFWTKTKSVCKWVSGSNHLLSSLTTENRA